MMTKQWIFAVLFAILFATMANATDPFANANGPYEITQPDTQITLDGSGSYEIDVNESIVSWDWTITNNSANCSPTTASGETVVIDCTDIGTADVNLVVTDSIGDVNSATTTITVNPEPNLPPVANAGGPYGITQPDSLITLNGSASSDPNSSDSIASWQWTITNNSANCSPEHPTGETTLINCTNVGTADVNLVVIDSFGASNSTTTTITVNEAPIPPATSNILITANYDTVNIEAADNIGVMLRIENLSSKDTACVELTPYPSDDELTAKIFKDEFCLRLPPNTYTKVALSITSSRFIENGNYFVDVEADSDGAIITKRINVNIEENPGIELDAPSRKEICKTGYTKSIRITVRNLTNTRQDITLSGESELFLPYFEPMEVRIDAGEEKDVELKININDTTETDFYTIPIFARTNDHYVERDVGIDLVDCEVKPFEIIASTSCKDLNKSEDIEISFVLHSLINEDQVIDLSLVSDLKVDLNHTSLILKANDYNSSHFVVTGRNRDLNGEHKMTLYAAGMKGYEEKEFCVEIEGSHKIEMFVNNNNLEQRSCSATDKEIFDVLIKNNGDFDEEIFLSISNSYSTIGVDISDEEFILGAKSEKTVYVTVNPAFDAPLGAKTIYLNLESGELKDYEWLNTDLNQEIVVKVYDFSEDVEEDTIKMELENVDYDIDDDELTFDDDNGEIRLQPSKKFRQGQLINVELDFEDEEGNRFELDFDYNITTRDMEFYRFGFWIEEFNRTIDEDTIEFIVNDITYTPDGAQLSFNSTADKLTFTPTTPFDLGEEMEFRVELESTWGDDYFYEGKINAGADFFVTNRPDKIRISQPLYFNVVEPEYERQEGGIEVLSYPQEIDLNAGSSKLLTFTVRNPTNTEMTNLRVKIWGLGSRVYFPETYLSNLGANETREISGRLEADETAPGKNYNLTLEITSDRYVVTRDVLLRITPGEAAVEEEDEFSGLVGLAIGVGLGTAALGLLILILLVVTYIIFLLLKSAKNTPRREVWKKRRLNRS